MKTNETGRGWPSILTEEFASSFRGRPALDLGSLQSDFAAGLMFPLMHGRVVRISPKATSLQVELLELCDAAPGLARPINSSVRAWRRFRRFQPTQCLKVGQERFCLLVGGSVMSFSDVGQSHPASVEWHEMPTAPLVAATDGEGQLFIGDYTGMGIGGASRVHVSRDCGRSWQTLAELQGVRHIHGLHWNADGSLLITTGDDDYESGVWRWSPAEGLAVVTRGSQLQRIVQVVTHAGGLLYGTDAPTLMENLIYLSDPITGERVQLGVCDAPLYFAASNGETAVLTTAAEPTSAGLTTGCRVFVVRGREVTDELLIPTDRLPIRAFGYGLIRCDAVDGGRFLLRHYGTIFDGCTQVLDTSPIWGVR